MGADIFPREWQDESQFINSSNNMARWSEREPVRSNMRKAYIKKLKIFFKVHAWMWAGYLSRYSDWLRAGRSAD
jgi:hypothetical protein